MSQVETADESGEYVVLRPAAMRRLAAEHRDMANRLALAEAKLQELSDRYAITEAELVLVREERDDLLRRAEAARSIWREVKLPPGWPTAEG